MKKTDVEEDGSFSYVFDKEDLKELILKSHPELIDDRHKFIEIDMSSKDVALIIEKNHCGKKIYDNDTIKCGDWSGGDQHFCKECFNDAKNETEKKQ